MKRLFGESPMDTRHPERRDEIDSKSVQDRLIEAAEGLFCHRGFNETSVRDIAAAAECNVASINYYFGGKDNLYQEIWRRRLAQIRGIRLASIERVMSADEPPSLEGLLQSYASSFIEPLVEGGEHCRFIILMAREMIDPHLPRTMYATELAAPVMAAFGQALRQLCPWLDEGSARLVILSIVGQLIQSICAMRMFAESGHPDLPVRDLEELVEHVVRFSAAGIRGYADVGATDEAEKK
jgi:AcrR family transcriptional regulator